MGYQLIDLPGNAEGTVVIVLGGWRMDEGGWREGDRADLTANVRLDGLEIGNEPDFYPNKKKLGAAWTPANYSQTWVDYAKGVSEVIQLGGDGPYLTPGAMTGFESPSWTPEATIEAGILDDDDIRANIKQFNQHVYSGAFGGNYPLTPVGGLMDKGTVRANLTTRADGLKAVKNHGLQYVFAEGNSYANHGQPGTSNTAEGALWALDWMLQLASMGVERTVVIVLGGWRMDEGGWREGEKERMQKWQAYVQMKNN
ncbi:hypothetical protein I305_02631 [Cryptococcus gattii E566]|nr:hypothetical protein I305_02631 [Cryptococcus gattii E566]